MKGNYAKNFIYQQKMDFPFHYKPIILEMGENMQKVMIVGAGKGGSSILKLLMGTSFFRIGAIIDKDDHAEGIRIARERGLLHGDDWKGILDESYDVIIEATGSTDVFKELQKAKGPDTVLIPGTVAYILSELMNEKEALIDRLRFETERTKLIFNSTDEGMVVVDRKGAITLLNKSAEKMIGARQETVQGKPVREVIKNSRLPNILESRSVEANKEQELDNGKKILTTRFPIMNEKGGVIGAAAIFRDITEVVHLANEITNLKEIQTMLEAIIQSSDEAISVVDELGRGILINPAYSRLTGLSEEEIIGKPANVDIYEGESIHMQVLNTRKPVRGAKLLVGPHKKEVIVNVAPIIVEGELKGSVGVLHDVTEIRELTRELHRARQIIRTLEAKYTFEDIIGTSQEMTLAIEQAKLSAKTPATVLLRGESGTGKELFAHAIHNASDRRFNKFVRVNCAAISESLLESELFGYEEGAFSGAKRGGKRGLFEEANNGSILLDEIGEMSTSIQVKLLRVLQENEIVRVGGTKPVPINVRIIAATNADLEKAIMLGDFREDLFYRLNRIPIHIPPLRLRMEELPLLINHLLRKLNQEYGRHIEGITEKAIEKLMEYHWPGNVRELENALGRAIIFMTYAETVIDVRHLPELDKKAGRSGKIPFEASPSGDLQTHMDNYEKQVIVDCLSRNKGNKTAASRELGISVRSLYYKLEKYNLMDKER